jgi:putative transposase
MPTTTSGKAKVQPNAGVKINYIYYWGDAMRNPKVEKTDVPVRFDPHDAGTAYAFINGQWIRCYSQHFSTFRGRSEREIQIASEELRRQAKLHKKNFAVTAAALARFLQSAEAENTLAAQRERDAESRPVLAEINPFTSEIHVQLNEYPTSENGPLNQVSDSIESPPSEYCSPDEADDSDVYEDF